MITDKDREWTLCFIETLKANGVNMSDFTLEIIDELMKKHRTESADKARKEAAERAVRFFDDFRICVPPNKYNMPQETLEQLRAAIIGDSVIKENLTTDHKYDCAAYATEGKTDAEKLAIAVKALRWALEYIGDGFLPEEGIPDHECGYTTAPDTGYCEFCENYWIARDALKEIQ